MTEHTQMALAEGDAPQEAETDLLDLLQVVVDNLRLLVLVPLLFGLVAWGGSYFLTPIFTATTKLLPPQQQQGSAAMLLQSLGPLAGLAGASGALKNPADQYIAFLGSNAVQDALIDRFKLTERFETDFREDTRKQLTGIVRVMSDKSGLISVSVDDKDPAMAAQLANAHVEELSRLLNRLAVTEAQRRRQFFEKQLAAAKDNLVKAEVALKSSGVNSSALKASPQAAVEGIARLQATIAAQEIKLASMRGYLTDAAPDFKQAQTELYALRGQLARAEKSDTTPGGADSDYVAMYRNFKYYETLFELFAKQYELARLDESREGASVQVIDTAQVPERKSRPRKLIIAGTTALTVGFGLLLFVFIRQGLRSALRNPNSAQKFSDLRRSFGRAMGRG